MENLYSKFLVMLFILTTISGFVTAQKSLLYIGRLDPPEGYMMDRDLIDSLTDWGYSITYITSPNYNSASSDIYNGMDGVFISETVNSSDLTNFGVRDNYPLPAVNTEGFTPRTNRWVWLTDDATEFHQEATDAGTEDDKIIVIKDNSHYITKIYAQDEEVAWSSASAPADVQATRAVSVKEVNVPYSAKLAKNKVIASDNDFWTMFTIDSSATFPNNMFYWGVVGPGINGADQLQHLGTQAFFTIIKRACEWTYGLIPKETSNNEIDYNYSSLVVFPNPAFEKATIRFRTSDAQRATVSIHDITGKQIEVLLDKIPQPGNNFVFVDVSKYPAGIYIIKLSVEDNTQYTKFIVR